MDYRMKSGLSLQTNYTYSKSIDNISISGGTSPNFINPFNKNAYRSLADADAPNRKRYPAKYSLHPARDEPASSPSPAEPRDSGAFPN